MEKGSQTQYVIFKGSRVYTDGPGYSGPSCEEAGVKPGELYSTYQLAKRAADKLTKVNGVGFKITFFTPAPSEE